MKPEIMRDDKTASVIMNDNVGHMEFAEAFKSLDSTADSLDEVLVDCKGLSVIRSEMIGQMVAFRKWAATKGIQASLLDMGPTVHQVLDISNLLQLFDIKYS